MKYLLSILLILWSFLILAVTAISISPYYFYERAISGNLNTIWFKLDNYEQKLLNPAQAEKMGQIEENSNLVWNNFHFQDFLIPLPIKNPFYFVAPILKYSKKTTNTQNGLRLFFPNGRTISEIYFVNQIMFPNVIQSQKIFKLPVFKKMLKKIPNDKMWKDIFNRKMGDWNINYSSMVYNLYLLQLRRTLFPKNFIEFKLLEDKDDTAIISLDSENKDFTTELILKKNKSTIYSYLLKSRKNVPESKKFRDRFLANIKFRQGSSSLSDYIYREFKALEYADKIDHLGMLYLYSAWSHQTSRKEFIQEMIEHLERGTNNEVQLMPLYTYASKRWDTTFSERFIEGLTNDKIKLKRSIELENKKELKEMNDKKIIVAPEKQLSEEEKIKLQLNKSKKTKTNNSNQMSLD